MAKPPTLNVDTLSLHAYIGLGTDISMHSATKFLSDHRIVIDGLLVDGGTFDGQASGKFQPLHSPAATLIEHQITNTDRAVHYPLYGLFLGIKRINALFKSIFDPSEQNLINCIRLKSAYSRKIRTIFVRIDP